MLNIRREGIYIDATVGLGGHAYAILQEIGPRGMLIGIDRDEESLRIARERLSDPRVLLMQGNFSEMETMIRAQGVTAVDGILLDLGVSSLHLRSRERGFSFASEALLDMRMDRTQKVSAQDIVNRYPEYELVRIFREYGEERRARRIAKAITWRRQKKSIQTCTELAQIVEKACGVDGRIHPATRIFQALRIAVNEELSHLEKGLDAALHLLKKGGRLCVISYHSLEDRIVKHFMGENAKKGLLNIITKKPVAPAPEEKRMNPSSRSAKLRVGEMV